MNRREEFQYYVTRFLTDHMAGQRNLSHNTISSYAHTFRLFLRFFSEEMHVRADRISLDRLTRDNVMGFLCWLENARGVSAASRNIRLAGIHSFVKFVQCEDPARLHEYQRILSIKSKKHQSREVPYLTVGQARAIIEAPDSSTRQGFRDKVLLTVLYDSAARVDELIHMRLPDVRLSAPALVTIKGKGDKVRSVPLMGNTVDLLRKYVDENGLASRQYSDQEFLFTNRSNNHLTRAGVAYLINKYVAIANSQGANITIGVHAHTFRHSKAVHLLEAGVELIYIRDILGHSSVTTTEIYARVCNARKREAIERAYKDISGENKDDWSGNKDLMSWLVDISKQEN